RQELMESKLTQKTVTHSDDSPFLLNMHALHNAYLFRETLPRHLTEPKPCFSDCRAKHLEFSHELQEIGPTKRADTVARGQAT
ncbi:hypothetical protein DFH07DRAFT_688713, partial [Mycena maculata]